MEKEIEITDANQGEILPRLEGLRIKSVIRQKDSGRDWEQGSNSITIEFEDGSSLDLVGWGYDASGIDASFTPAADQRSAPPAAVVDPPAPLPVASGSRRRSS